MIRNLKVKTHQLINWWQNQVTKNKKNIAYWSLIGIIVLIIIGVLVKEPLKAHLINAYHPSISKKTSPSHKGDYNYNKVKHLSLQQIMAARANQQSIHVIGQIAIPDIKLNVPIANGVSNTVLALAAGTMKPNQQMGKGNYALAGHNMDGDRPVLFTSLYYHAKVGQKAYLTDMKTVYEYRLTSRQMVNATDVSVVNNIPHKKLLTLVTCNETGSKRLVVQGKYVKQMQFKHTPKAIQRSLSANYTTGR